MQAWMRDSRAVMLLLAAFVAAVLLVNPIGNFPLDDDWGVGFTTFTLLETGRVQFTPFASATAYLQFAWGALWAGIFGPSFTTLRFATLTLSLATTLVAFLLLRRARVSAPLALFGAASLLFSPLFFWASFTSMTHVPFVFLSIVSAYAFSRAWEREDAWLVLAFCACLASFFTRQFAILNALAPLAVALAARRWRIAAIYGVAVLAFAVLALSGLLVGSEKELLLHRPSPAGLVMRGAHYVFFTWQHAALFLSPLLLLVLFSKERPRLSKIAALAAAIPFVYAAVRMTWQVRMPIPYMNSGNVFTDFGLGPPTLRDVFTLRMRHPFALPFEAKTALMILSTSAAVAAVALLPSAWRDGRGLVRFCVAYLLLGTLITAGMRINFDRYSIDTAWVLAPLLALLAATSVTTRRARILAGSMLVVLAFFAVAGTAEYLSWNRARWEAYTWLRARGVTLEQLDGGYEINSMLALRAGRKDLGKPGVGVVDDRFILSFNDRVPGYRRIATFPYDRWLGLGSGAVRVQQRR